MENNNNHISSIVKSNTITNRRSLKISVVHPADEALVNVNDEEKFLYEKRQWEIANQTVSLDKIQKEQMERYKGEWNWDVFIEFFLYHQIFFTILGPFMVILFSIWPGMTLMKNMKFYGNSMAFYLQTLLWIGSVLGGLGYFLWNESVITLTEILFLWYALTIRSVVIAAKYATFSKSIINLYKNIVLPDEVFQFDLMMGEWREQSPKILFLEPYRSLQRYQFEISLFKMDFIVQPHQETKVAIAKVDINFFKDTGINLDDDEYSGFQLFGYLANHYQAQNSANTHLYLCIFEAFVLSTTPMWFRIGDLLDSVDALDMFRMVLNIVSSFIGFWGSNIFFHQAFYDFNRKFFLLEQLLLIIKVRPDQIEKVKLLPTLNFNNITTWQAWSMMRAISFDYGQTYNLRTQGFYSLCFLGFIVLIFLSLLLILDFVHLDLFQLILLGELAIMILGFTAYYLFLGAKLNTYLDQCEVALQDVKSIYQDLLRMKEVYFEEKKEPQNYIHKKFKQLLQNQTQVEEVIKSIIQELDDNIRIIQYDSRNNPFKLYGIKITFNLLKSAAVGLSTVYSYSLQQRFMKIK
ncbi:unnamed protein product [Paramecium octaurelia]|uniref:Transmembrane protein n=1 Tax=Paramecium octaurelia TaxID=43137 RepID=A0A8S1W690_PAROT|nr:unnamed protein product [Paramecium octaurelia]